MGTLRCSDWIELEDGSKVSAVQGSEVRGIILGEPVISEETPNIALFNHESFPDGTINKKGKITPDEE